MRQKTGRPQIVSFTTLALLLLLLCRLSSAVSSDCVLLTGSAFCPNYNGQVYINQTANSLERRFQSVSDFDLFINSTIDSISAGLLGGGTLDCNGISPILRYPKTIVCSLILNQTQVVGTCNVQPQQMVCQSVCKNFTQILATIIQNSPDYCNSSPNASVLTNRQATINNMNVRCNTSPTTSCSLAEDNELGNCGFNSYYGAKDYCRQTNETCCQNLTATVATPIAIGCFQPLFGVITCDLLYGFIVFFVFAVISAVFSILFGQERKKHPYIPPRPASQISPNNSDNRNYNNNINNQGWPSTSSAMGGQTNGEQYSRPSSTHFPATYPPQSRVVSVIMLPPPGAAPWAAGAALSVPNAPSESSGRSRAASEAEFVKLYRVIQSFRPEQEGDIELLVGDKVTVTQDLGGGWVSGMNMRTQMEGVFPQSHAV